MSKRKTRHLSLPAGILLRPQLDALLSNAQTDPDKTLTQAAALSKNVTLDVFLTTLLRSFASTPVNAQAALTPHLSAWLNNVGWGESLKKIVVDQREEAIIINTAFSWLEVSGADVSHLAPVQPGVIFHSAFCYGNEIQASYQSFWHTDHRRNRMLLMAFLTDVDLPWQGSIKDAFLQPEKSPDAVRAKLEAQSAANPFGSDGINSLSAGAFKSALLNGLEQNRKHNIALPADFVPLRDFFAKNLLALPNMPDTPQFTLEDFDFLASNGQNVETLRHHEQQYGKRVRMPDGSELRVFNDFD